MAIDTSNLLSRMVGPVNIAPGSSTVFTAAASHIYTIKKIRIVNNTGAAVVVRLGIGGVADANLILPAISIDAGGLLDDDVFMVLSGGDTLQAQASATGTTLTVCGLDQS